MHKSETHSTEAIAARLADMTLADALAMAQEFETTAAAFYRDLARRIPPEVGPLAHELAEEEEEHRQTIARMAADPDLQGQMSYRIAAPRSTPEFRSYVTPLVLPEHPIDDDLLAYARAREEIAREHYGYLADLAPAGPLKELFVFLEAEEQKHANHLIHRWGELFSVL